MNPATRRIVVAVAAVVLLNALVMLGFSELLGSFTLHGPGAALGAALVTVLLVWFFAIGEDAASREHSPRGRSGQTA